MLVLKRKPGESIEIVQYGVTVKVARVIDSQSVWLFVDGVTFGPLRQGDAINVNEVMFCVTGFHGSKVKLGFDAPKCIRIVRTELLRGAA